MQRSPSLRIACRWLPVLLLCALSACGGSHQPVTGGNGGVAGNYTAPGTPGDPWGPYIQQASTRFDVPQPWIRAVIHQESGGHEYLHGQLITSDAGAMGLMQLMPATYGELAARYSLGSDPYEPHDNIMAGTGYISELYARYGSPAFLAAYNAGPHRLEAYLGGHGRLPSETVNYLASAAPNLGTEKPMTGPLAAFGNRTLGPAPGPVLHDYVPNPQPGCWRDPNAAYDPDAPCRTTPIAAPVPVQIAEATPSPRITYTYSHTFTPRPSHCWQDPNAAYDPTAPCRAAPAPAPVQIAQATPAAQPGWGRGQATPPAAAPYRFPGNLLIASATAATIRPAMATGGWGIQVGAFANAELARRTAESVRSLAPRELAGTQAVLGRTAPFGGQTLFRARLQGLSAQSASAACADLRAHSQACVTVPPGG